jgi:hypothetical protein
MRVSPSPSELFERLSDDEKVAIDLISERGNEEAVLRDKQLCALVPSEGRRGYLRTLAMQLPACVGDAAFDSEVAMWIAPRKRTQEAVEAFTPEMRRSVERPRRRRTGRRGRG